jgi:universal stress protein A
MECRGTCGKIFVRMKSKKDKITKLTSNDGEAEPQRPKLSEQALEVRLQKILVPVDFSDSSRKAVRYALAFVRQFNATILLLHVIEVVPPPPEVLIAESGLLAGRLHEEAKKQLSEWRKETASRAVNVAVRTGSPCQEIVHVAAESAIDLIILGTHGRKGLAHFLLGSTAEQVVRRAPCPVMVVRVLEHDFVGPKHSQ